MYEDFFFFKGDVLKIMRNKGNRVGGSHEIQNGGYRYAIRAEQRTL